MKKLVDRSTKLVVLIRKESFSQHQLHLLQNIYDELVDTELYKSELHKQLADLKRPELAETFTKIQLWALDYDKVLYLDADTLPLVEGPGSVADLLKLDFPKGKILAAPDSGFPDIFNSGVFLLKPDRNDYNNLLGLVVSNDSSVSFDGADQGLLNQYFNANPDWTMKLLSAGHRNVESALLFASNWIPIPFMYNTTPTAQYEYFPAFNHFGGQTPFGQEQAPIGPNEGLGLEYNSIQDQLSSYHYAAVKHFGTQRSQVKLIHFIGPVKPWNGTDSGIFKTWWDTWRQYSHGRLINDTLFQNYYPVTFKKLVIPSEREIEPAEIEAPEISGTEIEPAKEFTPADLCDPANYSHVEISEDAGWDATREEPPVEVPHYTSFDQEMKTFSNQWDEPEESTTIDGESFDVSEDTHPIAEIQEDEVIADPVEHFDYGFHKAQRAERVFDDKSDYIPLHMLLLQRATELVSEETLLPELPQPELDMDDIEKFSELSVNNNSFEDAEEEFEENGDVEIEREIETDVPKLFPWEFKSGPKAERSFNF